jgi:hypothetical protein
VEVLLYKSDGAVPAVGVLFYTYPKPPHKLRGAELFMWLAELFRLLALLFQ